MRRVRNNQILTILSSRITVGLFLILVLWIGYGVMREYNRAQSAQDELNTLRADTDEIFQSNKELDELLNLYNEEQYIEQEAKARLNLKRSDESVLIIVEDDTPRSEQIVEAMEEVKEDISVTEKKPNNIQKWWRFVFN